MSADLMLRALVVFFVPVAAASVILLAVAHSWALDTARGRRDRP